MQNKTFLVGQLRKLLLAQPNLKDTSAVFKLKSWLITIAELAVQIVPADVSGHYGSWSTRRHRVIPDLAGAVWWVQTLQSAIGEVRRPLEPEGIALHVLSAGEFRNGTAESFDLPTGYLDKVIVDGETIEEIVVKTSDFHLRISFGVIVTHTIRAVSYLCDIVESATQSREDARVIPLASSASELPVTRPPSVQNLFDAIIKVEGQTQMLMYVYAQACELFGRGRGPKQDEYPDRAEVRHRRIAETLARTAETRKAKGEPVDDLTPMARTEWEDTLSDLKESYVEWQQSIESALRYLPAAASVLDAGEGRDHERWTTKAKLELQTLSGLLHRDRVGPDAMGLARTGFLPLPKQFAETLFALAQRRLYLMGVTKKPRARTEVKSRRAEVGVESRTESKDPHKGAPTINEPKPRLTLVADNYVAILDGKAHALTPDAFRIVGKVVEGRGQYVSGKLLGSKRPGRIIERMPGAMREVVEFKRGTGGGFRIDPALTATTSP